MNIIRKGAAAIIRSWIVASIDYDEIAESNGCHPNLDDTCGAGTLQMYLEDYDEADEIASCTGIKGLAMAYFLLAPLTFILMVLNKATE